MRLVDLDPRWLLKDGLRVGFIFRCPLDLSDDQRWQSVFFTPIPHREQWALFEAAGSEEFHWIVQGCREDFAWTCAPAPEAAQFESLTIVPSIDGSAGGNWHGHIRNGEIVNV